MSAPDRSSDRSPPRLGRRRRASRIADKPAAPVFTDGWQAGQPDKVFTLPSSYTVAADGKDQFRCFVIPMNLDRDVYVKAFEFRPGDRRVVHHAIVFTDPTGASHALAGKDGSYSCFGGPGFAPTGLLGGWAPGSTANIMPTGMAATVRKGTDLVLQIHYHPSGKPEEDRSSVGLTFAPSPVVGGGLIW